MNFECRTRNIEGRNQAPWRNSQLETRNLKLETWNLELETAYGFHTAVLSAKYLLTKGGFLRLAYQIRYEPSSKRMTDWLVT